MIPLRYIRRDDKGIAVTEFGLLLVPLCILMFGVLDLGYMMYVRSVLQGALNDVARQATVETPGFGGTGTLDERLEAAIHSRLDPITPGGTFDIVTEHYDKFANAGRPEKLVTDANANGEYDPGDCYKDINENGSYDDKASREGIGGADDIAVYTVGITMERLFPTAGLIGFSPNWEFEATTAFRNQPYDKQEVPDPPTICTST